MFAWSVADDARVRAFLARVGRLTPAEWGRLDAVAMALGGPGPRARWGRARVASGLFALDRLVPPPLVMAAAMAGELALEVSVRLSPIPDPQAALARAQAEQGARDATLRGRDRAFAARLRRYNDALAAVVERAPAREAVADKWGAPLCLAAALQALLLRPILPPAGFRRAYAPVEALIPAASLDPPPALVPETLAGPHVAT